LSDITDLLHFIRRAQADAVLLLPDQSGSTNKAAPDTGRFFRRKFEQGSLQGNDQSWFSGALPHPTKAFSMVQSRARAIRESWR